MDSTSQSYAVFFGLAGAASSLIFSSAGAAYGTYRSAKGMGKVSAPSNEKQTKNIEMETYATLNRQTEGKFNYMYFIPVVIAGVLAIYGLIYAIISSNAVTAADYTTSQGYANFAGGLTLGLCCLVAGIAVGIIGEGGIIASSHNSKAFIPMVLNLIYAEALGLYGLIFGLIVVSLQF